jgi:CheY-like chemotaxis protein
MADECSSFVMVVDDDADLRDTIIDVLEDKQYRVVGAANGKEALDLLRGRSNRPCVILLDLMMPVMDGKAFHAQLMKDPGLSHIPVIVLSAHADIDSMLANLAVQAKLRKPVAIEPLLALVGQHCKRPPVEERL